MSEVDTKPFGWLGRLSRLPSPLLIETQDHDMLADSLVCEVFKKDKSVDQQHAVLKKVRSRSHPDWIRLEASHKLDDLRRSLIELRRRPFLESFRLLTIQQIDSTDRYFQNALLKTLEEPSQDWIILISCDSFSAVLPTLQSRCLKIKLPSAHKLPEMDEDQLKAYESVRDGDELSLFLFVEKNFSKRSDMREILQKWAAKASMERWPGHWRNMAVFLDEMFYKMDRNLNPRLVWQEAWEKSLFFKKEGLL